MQTIHWVLTVLSTVAALLALWSERRVADSLSDVQKLRAEMLGWKHVALELREEHAALKRRLDRLAGRFYRDVQLNVEQQPDVPETPDQIRARLRTEHGLPKIQLPARNELERESGRRDGE